MRKVCTLLALLFLFTLNAQRKKVGLVLGGGGAKGAAHIGVLKILDEVGIPVDYVAGTSIGAIVGAFYATGHSPEQIDSLMRQLNWSLLLSDQIPQKNRFYYTKEKDWKYVISIPLEKKVKIPAGIISGQNILNLFSDLTVGYHNIKSFNELPIPFACVATDMSKGNSVVMSSGSLPLAMRSSMSIPGLFAPVQLDSMILVDGGVLNNLPTNVVSDMGAEITIGIDLATPGPDNEELTSFNGMINKLVDMMGKTDYEKNKAALDLYIHPDLTGFNTLSFNAAAMDSMYTRGIEAAKKHMPELIALKAKIFNNDTVAIPSAPIPDSVKTSWNRSDKIHISEIRFDSISSKDIKWFKKKIELKENSIITVEDINNAIATMDGLDLFSSVTYELSQTTPAVLTFHLKKKALTQLNVGFRFDSESMASILLNTTLAQKFMRGSELSITAKLDKNPYLALGYKWGPGPLNKIGLNYEIGYHNFNLYRHDKRIDNLYFLWQTGEVKYERTFKNIELAGGLEWNYFGYSNAVYDTEYNPMPIHPGSFVNYFVCINLASFDDRYYPNHGWLGHVKAKLITDNFLGYHGKSPIGAVDLDFQTALPITRKFAIIPRITGRMIWGDEIPSIYLNYMGGDISGRYLPQQISFPGIRNIQLFKNTLLLGKLSLRYNIHKRHYVFIMGAYAKNSQKAYDLLKGTDIWSTALKYSYNSPIGPISAEVQYSNWVKKVGVYFNLGYYF